MVRRGAPVASDLRCPGARSGNPVGQLGDRPGDRLRTISIAEEVEGGAHELLPQRRFGEQPDAVGGERVRIIVDE
jgi:hypothetical protein